MSDIFQKLFDVIASRKSSDSETSYVAKLMHKGVSHMNDKVLEEASEVCEAALEDDKAHLIYEVCDLLFHTFVLASSKGVNLNEIESELERRFGLSGIEEKASRK